MNICLEQTQKMLEWIKTKLYIDCNAENAKKRIVKRGQANASNMMCVSKARLGKYVTDLSPSDMHKIDIAIAKHISLIPYYAKVSKKLDDKLKYIEQLKIQRNTAQDELSAIRNALEIAEDTSILEYIRNMKSH